MAVHFRRKSIGNYMGHGRLYLVFERAGYNVILARHKRLVSFARDFGRVVLFTGPHFGIVHACAMKICFSGSGHQSCNGYAGILELVANGLAMTGQKLWARYRQR